MTAAKIPALATTTTTTASAEAERQQQLQQQQQQQHEHEAAEVIALAVGDSGMQQLLAQAQQAQALTEAAALVAQVELADAQLAAAEAAAAAAGGAMDFLPLGSSTAAGVGAAPALTTAAAALAAGAAASGAPLKRKSIPLSMKKEAIEWILGPGKGVPSRAEKHFTALGWDVTASSFRKWWKNREKILGDASHKKRITGGGRKPYLEHTEEKLLVVVIQERAKKDRVTRKWIATTAQHMFQRTDASFKASENWVTKFIRRNGLTLKRSYVTYEQQQQVPPPPSSLPLGAMGVMGIGTTTAAAVGALGHSVGVGGGDDDDDDDNDGMVRGDAAHLHLDDDDDDVDMDEEHMGQLGGVATGVVRDHRLHQAVAVEDSQKTYVPTLVARPVSRCHWSYWMVASRLRLSCSPMLTLSVSVCTLWHAAPWSERHARSKSPRYRRADCSGKTRETSTLTF